VQTDQEPLSPITKGDTREAIQIFTSLSTSTDPETLRSVATGLAKIAHKGWQNEIDAHNGVTICLKLLKQPEARVYTKALALLNPLSASELCRPGLIAGGAVEFAWAYAADSAAEKAQDHLQECWQEALISLCNFACGTEQAAHGSVVDCGGVQALVDNLGTSLTGPVTAALESLSRYQEYHHIILGTAALTKLINVLSIDTPARVTTAAYDVDTLSYVAGTFANLAENVACHREFEIAGVTQALLCIVTEERPTLRREVARALANLCRVIQLQRHVLIHKYLWNTYAVLALSQDPADQEVATNFYLYISENENLAEILQYTEVPVADHLLLPVAALGYQPAFAERVALALGNLSAAVRGPMCQEEPCIQLTVTWLEASASTVCQSEAVRVLTNLCYQTDDATVLALNTAMATGAIEHLTALAAQNTNIVLKCDVSKLLALVCKIGSCHVPAIEKGILEQLFFLARSDDYVVKAEAVNSIGNIYNNGDCHPVLVAADGLRKAFEMSESDQALLSNRGVQMLQALCTSPQAHCALVQTGCLAVFQNVCAIAPDEIQSVIADSFESMACNIECCKLMCGADYVAVLQALASDRQHLLSSAALRLLMGMAERFHADGVSVVCTTALAELAGDPDCRAEMLETDGFARLSALTGCPNESICRDASRILAHFMSHASEQ